MVSEFNHSAAKALLPAPSILSTESVMEFERLFDKLLTCLNVQDALEAMLIRDLAELTWELHRYSRLRGLSFERSVKQSLDFQVQRMKAQQARKQEQIGTLAEHATQAPKDIAEVAYLERKLMNSPTDMAEILRRTPTELDHAHALEKHVSFHKDVELIVASISRRRNEALRLFDLYRAGLGKRVDEAMKEIIDAEPEVDAQPVQLLEAPTAVPSGDPSMNPEEVEEAE
jgi:hypothetical protein